MDKGSKEITRLRRLAAPALMLAMILPAICGAAPQQRRAPRTPRAQQAKVIKPVIPEADRNQDDKVFLAVSYTHLRAPRDPKTSRMPSSA